MQTGLVIIWTAGHSNTPVEVLLETLATGRIEMVVDVRQYPISRRNPQFNRERLAATLADPSTGSGEIDYLHVPELGGRRTPLPDSANAGLRNAGFRGFADYMQTPEFETALRSLIDVASERRVAIMCAESVPWKCHRSLIADALTARGVEVRHLVGGKEREHALTTVARVEGERVRYPALL